jgi:hypothetical protein
MHLIFFLIKLILFRAIIVVDIAKYNIIMGIQTFNTPLYLILHSVNEELYYIREAYVWLQFC